MPYVLAARENMQLASLVVMVLIGVWGVPYKVSWDTVSYYSMLYHNVYHAFHVLAGRVCWQLASLVVMAWCSDIV